MLSDEKTKQAELNELLSQNPEFIEYDNIFKKMRDALTLEVQTTKKQIFAKLDSLNKVTESNFDKLFDSCDEKVKLYYDRNRKTNENKKLVERAKILMDSIHQSYNQNNEDSEIPQRNYSSLHQKQKIDQTRRVSNYADFDGFNGPNNKERSNQRKVGITIKENKKEGNDEYSSEYSDEVLFGFLGESDDNSDLGI